MKTGILAIGASKPANTWRRGCRALGIKIDRAVINRNPKTKEIRDFFRQSPDWIYLSGHFGGTTLYNNHNRTRTFLFKRKQVVVTIKKNDGTKKRFVLSRKDDKDNKKDESFKLYKNCKVVFWGGCSVCAVVDTIDILRELFGEHLLLGYAGGTNGTITNAILGGGRIHKSFKIEKDKSFFGRLDGKKIHDLKYVRETWMETALDAYGGRPREDLIKAIDPDGQRWRIHKNGIKGSKGRAP